MTSFRYIGKLEDIESDLYYACLTGLHAVAIKLLEAGSNVNAQGGECRCPLNAAVCRGHKQLAKRLIDWQLSTPIKAAKVCWADEARVIRPKTTSLRRS
jgi:hypothetical protein